MTTRFLTADKFIRKLGEVYYDISQSLHFKRKIQMAGNISWKNEERENERTFIATTAA